MKNLLIIISLFLIIFNKSVFAEEKFVTIETIPLNQEIIIGQTFPVNVVLKTNNLNTTFYYLFYGGLEGKTSYIQTRGEDGPILSFIDDPYDWDNIPTFTTDLSGNGYLQSNFAYINPNTPPGNYSLYVKLFLPDFSSDDKFISDPQPITVIPFSLITITPTSVPTPTPKITPVSPTATNTPIPTSIIIFSNAIHNQIPILTPSPTINMKIFGTIISSTTLPVEQSVLSPTPLLEDPNITFIKTGSNPPEIKLPSLPKKNPFISFVILISVSSLLMILLIFLKIKKR